MRELLDAFGFAVSQGDYAVAEDSFWALHREEARLAREVVAGVKSMALEKVTRV